LIVDDIFDRQGISFVRVRAATAKHPKETMLRLRSEVVDAIRSITPIDARPGTPLFPRGIPRMVTFKKDLVNAKIDFLDVVGRRADFHSLRETFGTQLAVSGAAPFVLKELMRHTTVQQSEKYYIDSTHLPLATALNRLPDFSICHES
jgi:integrase